MKSALGSTGPLADIIIKMSVLVNACLSYTQHFKCYAVGNRDKDTVQKLICSKFSLDAIKFARQIIFTYYAPKPEPEYVYVSPDEEKSSYDKCVHAFEGIYSQLDLLEKGALPPVLITCPSCELNVKFAENQTSKVNLTEVRLHNLESSYEELKCAVMSMVKKPNPSSVQRDSSSSVSSQKRDRSSDFDVNKGFSLPKQQIKRRKRSSKVSADMKDNNVKLVSENTPQVSTKKTFNWG